jgi:Uma2 family endonuclease
VERIITSNPDPHIVAERARLGIDKKDELWDGVLHMVPPPSSRHETIVHELLFFLKPVAERLGLVIRGGNSGLFGTSKNYRIPDLTIARPESLSERGWEAAELVVEVLSKNDLSRQKFGFYASRGVREIWLIDPATRSAEMYALAEGAYVQMPELQSQIIGVVLEWREKLHASDGDRVVEI